MWTFKSSWFKGVDGQCFEHEDFLFPVLEWSWWSKVTPTLYRGVISRFIFIVEVLYSNSKRIDGEGESRPFVWTYAFTLFHISKCGLITSAKLVPLNAGNNKCIWVICPVCQFPIERKTPNHFILRMYLLNWITAFYNIIFLDAQVYALRLKYSTMHLCMMWKRCSLVTSERTFAYFNSFTHGGVLMNYVTTFKLPSDNRFSIFNVAMAL